MTDRTQPEALRLAEMLEQEARLLLKPRSAAAAAELRSQHARIAELEQEVAHTDGLLGKANALARIRAHHIAELETKLSSSGFTAADMATAAAQGFRDGVASVAASALTSITPETGNSATAKGAAITSESVAASAGGEPVASRAFLERALSAMEGVIDVADRQTDEFEALRSCVIDLTLMLFTVIDPPKDPS